MICPFKYSNYTPKYNKVVAMLGPPIRALPKKTTVVVHTYLLLLFGCLRRPFFLD